MLELFQEIQAISQTGLHYAQDPYDVARYSRLREIAFELLAQSAGVSTERVRSFFVPEVGYATPKVDLRACVVHEDRVLLVRERSDGKWTLPGGWADQNESPVAGTVREVKEESGYDVKVESLYAIRHRDRHDYAPRYPVSIYKLFFTASVLGGCPRANTEISEIGFFDPSDLPELSESRVLARDIVDGFCFIKEAKMLPVVD
jgi:ADP-ribose pyrophosphatase YjhB (NUDIX family)